MAACEDRPPIPDAPRFADAAPPASRAVPALPPVAGATADAGRAAFARRCAGCHGVDGRGGDAPGPVPPTDLTGTGFLCLSAPEGGPTDADLEATLDRGAHRFSALAPVERRSLALFLRSLRPPGAPDRLLDVPAEPADSLDDRARGRTLYLAFGCWRCHGATGAGDGTAVRFLAWNRRGLTKLRPLSDRSASICGDAPERLYLTIALGLGGRPALMPPHLATFDAAARPAGAPEMWTKSLAGASTADVAAVQAFYAALPAKADLARLSAEERRKRSAAWTWALVHYLRGLGTE
ncbi:MAG TPA: c-type cytochrome [Haliangiales bacterium]|nr:c-type cytochrome [Haliangiales bacterium]